ncbi:riboflavin kinase isoform X2 [Melitaea cinxia]|uniref:riboflavin kinase isoform X2 n=1 Tax=Melitaea cinxia TaxID=113334 RepID=UPI001E271712|nr:riboflavin kinase isoform X2 [Melitaea cinxia]XP_045454850.1 riboflavin kinase isoform X2 [Melitaea cinxia]
MSQSYLPFFLKGEVVRGFGRGSKDLGCPTANYPRNVAKSLPEDVKPGVYYGWAKVDTEAVHKMVVNIGWCPFYQNKELSIETHVMHDFERDFYGAILKICVVGYLRPEKNFTSLEKLIETIKQDIENANVALDLPESIKLKDNSFFTDQ